MNIFAKDFLFDGQRASDFGCMVCSFNGSGGLETAAGGEIEYNAVKLPGRNEFGFYGSQFNTAVTWNFSICKNPCKKGNYYFDQYEESMIRKWLVKTDGYRMMQFDQDGYEDIFYNVYFNAMPHQHLGKTVGFDLTATSDCAYGFTDIIKKKAVISSQMPLEFHVHSDLNAHILPTINLRMYSNIHEKTQISILNTDCAGKTESPMTFKNILSNHISANSRTKEVSGLDSPDDFNWNYLKLRDGKNIITTSGTELVEIEILYREPRLITV